MRSRGEGGKSARPKDDGSTVENHPLSEGVLEYPEFDGKALHREYHEAFPNNVERAPDRPNILQQIGIAPFFIILASIITSIFEQYPERCPFVVAIAAITVDFLNRIDLDDPATIIRFVWFYYRAFDRYAARYRVDEKDFVAANLGELRELLGKLEAAQSCDKAKKLIPTIMMITAFATFDCMIEKPSGSLNGIHNPNPSVGKQDMHFRHALMDATGKDVSTDAARAVRESHVHRMDFQLRHAIVGGGTSYPEFRKELNEEKPNKEFFEHFGDYFDGQMPNEGFVFDGNKVDAFESCFVDLLNGITLFVLVAMAIRAVSGRVVTAMLATERCRAVFEGPTGDEDVFTPRFRVGWLWECFGEHPDRIKYLGMKNQLWKHASLDAGYTQVITALAVLGAEVEVGADDEETELVRVPAVSSRLHSETGLAHRIGKEAEMESNEVTVKARKLEKRLKEVRAERRALTERRREVNLELKPSERQAEKMRKRAEGDRNLLDLAASLSKRLKQE